MKRVLVTGGAGFIGSALCRRLASENDVAVLNIDKLTYAANLDSVSMCSGKPNYEFLQADIADHELMIAVFDRFRPTIVMHLAAESHVDRSILSSHAFMASNILGTWSLLEAARLYWGALPARERAEFRFLHVSTDEVYGSLGPSGRFTEDTAYAPRSPYSASKAAADHLVDAWHETYGLPTLMTNCSNNYGPYHYPEKLIPLIILNALHYKPLPVYGDGMNVRDWLYVEDHVAALWKVANDGRVGERYNIGARCERTNISVVQDICRLLDEVHPGKVPRVSLVKHVEDRLGHDRRYAIDPTKIETELGWKAKESFESGLHKTVRWYLDNEAWWMPAVNGGGIR